MKEKKSNKETKRNKDHPDVMTVFAEPLQKEDLLQGKVEESVPVVPLNEIFVKPRLMAQHVPQIWEVVY